MLKGDLKLRTISAVFILGIMLAMVFINGLALLAGVLMLSSIAIYELGKALKNIDLSINIVLAIIFNIIYLLAEYFIKNYSNKPLLSLYLVALLVIMIFSEKFSINNVAASIFVAVYITVAYSYLIIIGETQWLFFLFGISSVTDTFAYLVGVTIGKNKLYEKLSPKKTIEGSMGGILGAILFAFLFIYIYRPHIQSWLIILVTIIMSVLSQIGDLIASYIKRKAKIKDYGNIFAGHGGIMDRFDSILLILPVLAYLLTFF